MRTKSLLAVAALLAAGAASSMAQSNVYSLNVVGYVNTVIEGGGTYNFLANPLNNANNNLTNLFSSADQQPSSQILTWDVVNFDFDVVQPAYVAGAWNGNKSLPPGVGFFYVNAGNTFTNTFVGDVLQGSITNIVVGSGSYNAIGSPVPYAGNGSFTNAIIGITPGPSDQVLVWDKVNFDFSPVQPAFVAGAWNADVNVKVGEGLFYVNANSDITWVRNFTVQ